MCPACFPPYTTGGVARVRAANVSTAESPAIVTSHKGSGDNAVDGRRSTAKHDQTRASAIGCLASRCAVLVVAWRLLAFSQKKLVAQS